MLAMDTNKLVIRLEKLMTSLPVHDPVKRRAHEQAVVPWAPEDVVKLCPNCAKSFNLTRSEQQLFFALQLNLRVTGIWHTDIINLHVFRVITLLENKAIRVDLLHVTMMFDTKTTTHQSWVRGDCLGGDINRYN